MADTCIVCLGELAGADPSSTSDVSEPKLELPAESANIPNASNPDETIAHLLPCGHDLHHECLKPWVERANSCPICRQSFVEVELKNDVYGPTTSSYAVQEKRQVADVDPLVIDDDLIEEPNIEPCILCERFDDEDVLLLCDGCNASCHTYCTGLESVPPGSWFCQFCHEDGNTHTNSRPRRRTTRTSGQRRRRTGRDQSPDAWAQVWQSVFHSLNLDLEFPFDEDLESAARERAQRQEFSQWQRRFRVAERQGGAARFRDTAATLLDRRRAPTPQPESQEELRAWNAFDKAREVNAAASGLQRRNKRKSPTASPAEPQPAPERTLKRPRTKRVGGGTERANPTVIDQSASLLRAAGAISDSAPSPPPQDDAQTSVHDSKSFFHSLLREVETSPTTPNTISEDQEASAAESPSPDSPSSAASSRPASPALSPISPSRSRSASPIRYNSTRPSSPPLTSCVLPIFNHSPRRDTPSTDINESRYQSVAAPASSLLEGPLLTKPMSPGDAKLEQVRSIKAEIQAMVADALTPAYRKKEIDKTQYTNINRDVSRHIYDRISKEGGPTDEKYKEWQPRATEAVNLALAALHAAEVKIEVAEIKDESVLA